MTKVLAPSLECLRVGADFLTKGGERIAEAVRIKIVRAAASKAYLNNRRMAAAPFQCFRSRPEFSRRPLSPMETLVAG